MLLTKTVTLTVSVHTSCIMKLKNFTLNQRIYYSETLNTYIRIARLVFYNRNFR